LLQVNTIGVLVLFQATYALLKASKSPKFIPISSGVGSLSAYISMPLRGFCYGTTKVALNYMARKIHFENEWLSTHLSY
jgi:NAD(P)-dependent dehydrogenase (short-subunit alcohol dehydrogenase family)